MVYKAVVSDILGYFLDHYQASDAVWLVCDHCLSDEVEGTNRSRLYLACFSRDELVSSGWICFGDAAPMLPLHGVSESLVFRLVD